MAMGRSLKAPTFRESALPCISSVRVANSMSRVRARRGISRRKTSNSDHCGLLSASKAGASLGRIWRTELQRNRRKQTQQTWERQKRQRYLLQMQHRQERKMLMTAFQITWKRKRRQQQRQRQLLKDRHRQKLEKTSRQRRHERKKKKIQRQSQSKRRESRLRAIATSLEIRMIRTQMTREGTLAKGQRSRYWIQTQVMKLLWPLKEKRQLLLPM
mmetsp:Transcript_61734/g.144555  ORF Transcript_61734/g.144555 Transcript_61734/m.144555 type:complete len:215 (-) Transcript_61734:970-1614(-)